MLLRLGLDSQEVPSAIAKGQDPALCPTKDLRPEDLEALRQDQLMASALPKADIEQDLFVGRERELAKVAVAIGATVAAVGRSSRFPSAAGLLGGVAVHVQSDAQYAGAST